MNARLYQRHCKRHTPPSYINPFNPSRQGSHAPKCTITPIDFDHGTTSIDTNSVDNKPSIPTSNGLYTKQQDLIICHYNYTNPLHSLYIIRLLRSTPVPTTRRPHGYLNTPRHAPPPKQTTQTSNTKSGSPCRSPIPLASNDQPTTNPVMSHNHTENISPPLTSAAIPAAQNPDYFVYSCLPCQPNSRIPSAPPQI